MPPYSFSASCAFAGLTSTPRRSRPNSVRWNSDSGVFNIHANREMSYRPRWIWWIPNFRRALLSVTLIALPARLVMTLPHSRSPISPCSPRSDPAAESTTIVRSRLFHPRGLRRQLRSTSSSAARPKGLHRYRCALQVCRLRFSKSPEYVVYNASATVVRAGFNACLQARACSSDVVRFRRSQGKPYPMTLVHGVPNLVTHIGQECTLSSEMLVQP